MYAVVFALIGAALGALAIAMGLRIHVGSWFYDGQFAYVISIIAGGVVGLMVHQALRKTFGWP